MAGDQVKILMAEDDNEISEIFSLKLKEVGFDVDLAKNGHETLKALENNDYDVILLDLVMPEMDGYQVLEKIKDTSVMKKALVCVWSNLTQKDEIKKAQKYGIAAYLIKSDYTPSKLVDKINKLIKNKNA